MAAPPSPNLLGEIILIARILSYRYYSLFILVIITFFAGAYCLILYTITQHGGFSNFGNSLFLISRRNYRCIILHVIPLILIILKRDIINL